MIEEQITCQSDAMEPVIDFGAECEAQDPPEPFSSGWRGHQVIHSRELAAWMGVPNVWVEFELINQIATHPYSWEIGNCWNRNEVIHLDHSKGTFTRTSNYWISQSVAADLCRRFRRDLLPEISRIFMAAHADRLGRRAAYAVAA
jgi:hypothetical protein